MRTNCWTQKRVITITSKSADTPKKSNSLFRLFKAYFRPHLSWFIGGTVFAILTALFANSYAAILAFVGNGIQGAIESSDADASWVWWAAGGIVVLATGRAVSLYLMTILNNTGVQRALVDIQQVQFDDLIDGDFARLSGDASGGFVSRFINDVNSVRDAGLRFANNFTKSVVTVLGAFGIMLYLDWQITLADNDLRKVSHMCSLAGVDVAYPMLDDELVEFSCTVPSEWKIKDKDLRHFYKESLKGWLPRETIEKTKQGFGLPFGVWMRTYRPLREMAYDNLLKLKSRGLIRPAFIDKAMEMHQSQHAAYYGELVWILTVFELWMQGHSGSHSQ